MLVDVASKNPRAIIRMMPWEPPITSTVFPVISKNAPLPLQASGDLEQSSGAHAAADAHGDDDVADASALALDQRVTG